MKALILVGGFGTRLRPLTFSCPKPLVEFGNKPVLVHQIEALAKVGVTEIVLAVAYQPEVMQENLAAYEKEYGVKITCSQETTPLGTAGPLKLAEQILKTDNESGMFFVLNADVICEYPFGDLLEFHKSHGREGTIMVFKVDEPSRFGVVVSDEDGRIQRFVEKPKEFISSCINAGLYLFNTSIIDRIENRPTSIEREIFPKMAEDADLYSFVLQGFWMDVGQPKDFIIGTRLYLQSLRKNSPEMLAEGEDKTGNVLIDPSARINGDCYIGPNVTIGPNCVIEEGARIANTVVLANSRIGAHSWISQSIIGWRSSIQRERLCGNN